MCTHCELLYSKKNGCLQVGPVHLVFVIDNVVEATFFREQLGFFLFSSSGDEVIINIVFGSTLISQ
jgi:hypothetical protein